MSPKDIAASVRQRLLNRARAEVRDFQSLLTSYAMERFLRRLSASVYSERFVLKGALMLRIWQCPASRPTVDADFLGHVANDVEAIARIVREICQTEVEEDGMRYDVETLQAERITEDADYGGVRVTFKALLGKARVRMQLDIGFGDIVVPPPETAEYPTILPGMESPKLRVYSRESAVAEKFEAMVKLGELNSRMKDFYDVWVLAKHYAFRGPVLAEALTRTFQRRDTAIPAAPVVFSDSFALNEAKRTQWAAFLKKISSEATRAGLQGPPQDFQRLMRDVTEFLGPVANACARGQSFDHHWNPPGPWKPP